MRLFLLAFLGVVAAAEGATWSVGVREGGNGFYLASDDRTFQLSLLGYGQFTANGYSEDYRDSASRPDAPFGFGLRRARLDMIATLFRNWELLTEVGTPTTPLAGVDIGIVESRLTVPLWRDIFLMRFGRFVVPFSAENSRSSRRLSTIERSNVLNSLIAANFLDNQTGLMIYGRVAEGILNYYFGLFNGNGLSGFSDDNGYKEAQVKLVFNPAPAVTFGFAYDTHHDATTALTLVDHSFTPYLGGVVGGRRHGFEVDFEVTSRIFSFALEVLGFTFPESPSGAGNEVDNLWGLLAQTGLFLKGDESDGFQLIFRYEFARLSADVSGDLHSVLAGFNAYLNPNVRYQMNAIVELPSRATSGPYAESGAKYMVLNEVQLKF